MLHTEYLIQRPYTTVACVTNRNFKLSTSVTCQENSLLWVMWQAIHFSCCLTTNHAEVLHFCILCFGAQRIFNPFPHSRANLMGGSEGLQKCWNLNCIFFSLPQLGRYMRLSTWLLSQSYSAGADGFVGERYELLFAVSVPTGDVIYCCTSWLECNKNTDLCVSCFLSKPQACMHFSKCRATSAVLSAFAGLLQLACSAASLPEPLPWHCKLNLETQGFFLSH